MIQRYCEQVWFISPYAWGIMLAIPILLAAGGLEQSNQSSVILPEESSYRSNFSDLIFESAEWRKPSAPELPWRKPIQSELGWRTSPTTKSSSGRSPGGLKLFPRYRPGRTTDFDPLTREEKPLIKIFEFGG